MKKREKDYSNYPPEKLETISQDYKMFAGTAAYLQKTYDRIVEPNTLLIDLKENDIYQTWIDADRLPYDNLLMSRYNKDLVYTLIRDKSGECKPVEWPAFKKENVLPEELYRHLKCPEANILFQIPQGLLDKINTTILVILGIVALFIAWLMMQGG